MNGPEKNRTAAMVGDEGIKPETRPLNFPFCKAKREELCGLSFVDDHRLAALRASAANVEAYAEAVDAELRLAEGDIKAWINDRKVDEAAPNAKEVAAAEFGGSANEIINAIREECVDACLRLSQENGLWGPWDQ